MASPFRILNLPADILVLIFPYLEPEEFLSFCKINRACWDTWHREPEYWRTKTRETFRIPNHPLLQADGERWNWLYRKMRTDTKAFTWGQNSYHSLGQGPFQGTNPQLRRRHIAGSRLPKPMHIPEDVGIIADLQCGGWSTTMLNSDGVLFSVGIFDAADGMVEGLPASTVTRLAFPPGYPETSKSRTDPSTAIKEFSSGRRHVLALSDDGKVWSWHEIPGPASRIEFRNIVPHESVMRVVAGWAESSAYVRGTGLVYWPMVGQIHPEVRGPADDGASLDVTVVPNTLFITPKHARKGAEEESHDNVGEVTKHICLEDYIVFLTKSNKVFGYRLGHENVFQLTSFYKEGRKLRDIQGSFRSFAVFSDSGEVLTADKPLLDRWSSISPGTPTDAAFQPDVLPVLQNNNVISIAFGDYHMHALHSTGRISSYGSDSSGCGALGLGHPIDDDNTGKWRGLGLHFRDVRIAREADGRTFPHYVWFEPEKQKWLEHLSRMGMPDHHSQHHTDRVAVVSPVPNDKLASFSEWVEQEGLAWDDFPHIRASDPDGLGAYFALNVAAAGWHSGALVLVNEDLAKKVRETHVAERNMTGEIVKWRWSGSSFPKVMLPNGYVVRGDARGQLQVWRSGMPEHISS